MDDKNIKNKLYANSKIGDFPALSKIFNNMFKYCGSSVFKPPQINSTTSVPIQGIALIKLVIQKITLIYKWVVAINKNTSLTRI